jgi:hypothetical protein
VSISFYAATAPGVRPINFENFEETPNLNNGSALAVLKTLGLVETDEEMWSASTMHLGDFRRACLHAMNCPERSERCTVQEIVEPRYMRKGLDEADIMRRVRALHDWAERMMARGALMMWWG